MESLTQEQLAYIERHGRTKNPKTIARDLKLELRHVQTALRSLQETPAKPAAPAASSRETGIIAAFVLAIVVLGFAAYANNLEASWHFDDAHTVTANEAIQNPSFRKIREASTYRQVFNWTLAFSWWRNGTDMRGWHLENNAIHVANALLVFAFSLITLRSPGGQGQTRAPVLVAGLAGLVFALHPLQTQAVTYITQRAESLCATFYLGALTLYAIARIRRAQGRATRSLEATAVPLGVGVAVAVLGAAAFVRETAEKSYLVPFLVTFALAVVGTLAALGHAVLKEKADPVEALLLGGSLLVSGFALQTKEIAGTIPVAILLWEVLFAFPRGEALRPLQRHAAALPYAAMLVTGMVLAFAVNLTPRLLLREGVQDISDIKGGSGYGLHYGLTQLSVLGTYVRLYLLPYGQTLDHDYPLLTSLAGPALLGFVFVAAAAAVAWYARRRVPAITWAVGFAGVVLAPTTFFALPDVIFEHRVYLPLAGLTLVSVLVLERIVRRAVRDPLLERRVLVGACVPVLAVLLVLTRARNEVWATEETLWKDAAEKSPKKPRTWTNLGLYYQNVEPFRFELTDGKVVGGEYVDGAAVGMGDSWILLPTLGGAGSKLRVPKIDVRKGPVEWGGVKKAAAEYDKALALDPGYYKARNNYALCEVQAGVFLLDRARDARAANLEDRAKAIEAEATLKFRAAEGHFKRIVQDYPKDYVALNNLGNLYFAYLDRLDEAAAAVEKSIQIQIDEGEKIRQPIIYAVLGDIYFVWANELADKNDSKGAIEKYQRAAGCYRLFLEGAAPTDANIGHGRRRLQLSEQGILGGGVRTMPQQGALGNPFQGAAGMQQGKTGRFRPGAP